MALKHTKRIGRGSDWLTDVLYKLTVDEKDDLPK